MNYYKQRGKELEFITIGKCLRVIKNDETFTYEIHFKGYYRGHHIQKIFLKGKKRTQELFKAKDYIIHVKYRGHKTKELYGKIISVKEIDKIKSDFL